MRFRSSIDCDITVTINEVIALFDTLIGDEFRLKKWNPTFPDIGLKAMFNALKTTRPRSGFASRSPSSIAMQPR
jgi:hypothetical protein